MEHVVGAAVSSLVAFVAVYAMMPGLIRYLTNRNMTVPDVHKKGHPMVARPGGIAIIAGIMLGEVALYALMPSVSILAIMTTTFLAFVVGYVDDRRVMGGWYKPLALAGAAVPIILLGAYDTDLAFPLFGEIHIPLLYLGIIVVIIPITGNTINSIDILNGVVSGFMIIASASLTASLLVVANYDIAVASLPMLFASLAFYKYHKNPSRIFPGDSGTLALGAMYGTIAIVGQVEVVAAVALLPAVINSFLFLSSLKRLTAHHKIKVHSVIVTDDFKLKAIRDPRAAVTLIQLIVSRTPLTPVQATSAILRLAMVSGALAVISAFLMNLRLAGA